MDVITMTSGVKLEHIQVREGLALKLAPALKKIVHKTLDFCLVPMLFFEGEGPHFRQSVSNDETPALSDGATISPSDIFGLTFQAILDD
jgi:hypothetical protein